MNERETLYGQLPAIHRRRDAEQGEPLRALLAIIDAQLQAVQADVETTWDNWFVETAEEWLVPYLGQALGVTVARDIGAIAFSRRSFVANTLRYRRGKGTPAMVELLARDLTNYPTRVVEFFTRMAWNEALNHQTGRAATLDIRDTAALERLSGPFGEAARTAEVRRIASGRGTVNLPNMGLFMWRTQLWRVTGATASPIAVGGTPAWHFQPVAGDRPLYAPLETESDPSAVATEASVPLALTRRRLWAEARRHGAAMAWPFAIEIHGQGAAGAEVRPVPGTQIDICHLGTIPASVAPDRVLVDPQRGAFVAGASFTAGLSAVEFVTDHYIATPGRLGAGPWSRDEAAQAWLDTWTGPPESRQVGYQCQVLTGGSGPGTVGSMDAAVQGWNDFLAALPDDTARSRALGLILVADGRTHALPPARVVRLPTGAVLGIVAARWPQRPDPAGGPAPVRLPGDLLADELRPVLVGTLRVEGLATGADNRGALYIDGLCIDGAVQVERGDLQGLLIASCTVLATPAIDVDGSDGANAGLELELLRSVVAGDIAGHGAIARITSVDTAVTGAVHGARADTSFSGSTVLGALHAGSLEADNSVFDATVLVEQQQQGCVRFCYLPPDSRTPRRFRCQPEQAIEDAGADAAAVALARLRVRPQYRSRDPHAPGFLLLDDVTALEVRAGAEDGGEPGCWHHLQHGTRLANLQNALPEYLRFGLEAGCFFLV